MIWQTGGTYYVGMFVDDLNEVSESNEVNNHSRGLNIDLDDLTAVTSQTGSITGLVWNDLDGNGLRDSGEPVLTNWTVFLDTDNDGVRDTGDTAVTTNSTGTYTFSNLAQRTYTVAQVIPTGYTATFPTIAVGNWVEKGPIRITGGQVPGRGYVSGRVAALAADPVNANIFYAAAAYGGLWKTTDAGQSWTPLTDQQATLSMGAVAVSRSNPSIIYAGTGESTNSGSSFYGRGILKSTNGGTSWALLGSAEFDRTTISEIAIHPTDPNTVYVAVADGVNGGLRIMDFGKLPTVAHHGPT